MLGVELGRGLSHCLQGTSLPHPVSLLNAGKRCVFKGCPTTTSATSQVVEPLDVYRFMDIEAKRSVGGAGGGQRTAGKMSTCLVGVLEMAQPGGR